MYLGVGLLGGADIESYLGSRHRQLDTGDDVGHGYQ
jgi:hypothetical protein